MEHPENAKELYDKVKDVLIEQKVIFFGGYAMSQYLKYSSNHNQSANAKNPVSFSKKLSRSCMYK